jgi:hypothetical protein
MVGFYYRVLLKSALKRSSSNRRSAITPADAREYRMDTVGLERGHPRLPRRKEHRPVRLPDRGRVELSSIRIVSTLPKFPPITVICQFVPHTQRSSSS